MKDKKLVVFDLDGTLTDSMEGIANSAGYALKKMGMDDFDKKRLRKFMGPPIRNAFREIAGLEGEQIEQAVAFYREYYAEKGIFENNPYEGIKEMLANLADSGKVLSVATFKPEVYAVKVLEYFDLLKFFRHVSGSGLSDDKATKHDIIIDSIKNSGSPDPALCVMVGDRHHDVIAAKEAGIECVGVTYGYGSKEELMEAGASHIARSPKEVAKLLL